MIKEERLYLVGRLAIFIVFFWFGFLKLFGLSPANALVESLLAQTIPFWPFESFIIVLGLSEMLIGLLFLIPRFTWVALWILLLHMLTTFFPLLLLPTVSWQAPFVPTLEGQYILKNLIVVALALLVGFHSHLLHKKKSPTPNA